MNFDKLIKILLAGTATILLGAIGSGVWEKLLSPGIKFVGEKITSILSTLSQSYSDSIYIKASQTAIDDMSGTVGSLLIFLIFIVLFSFALNSKKENSGVTFFIESVKSQFTGWWGIIYTGALLVFSLFILTTNTAVHKVSRYSIKNMEIIRPYIDEKRYFMLRSNFIRMKSERDFNAFLNELYSASSDSKIEIEKYNSQ